MAQLTGIGRLNSKSRKVLICSPKKLAIQYKLVNSACSVKPKFDTAWVLSGLDMLKHNKAIPAQWLCQEAVSPIKQKPRVLHFGSANTNNGIRGWDKLNGIEVPTE